MFANEFAREPCFKAPGSLITRENSRIPNYNVYDPVLIRSIREFKNEDPLYRFLSHLTSDSTDNHKIKLQKLMNIYIDFVAETLEITPDGIKSTKRFKQLSAAFQQQILGLEHTVDRFRQHLLHYLNSLHQSNKRETR